MRVTAKTDDEAAALALLNAEERLVSSLLGDHVFGVDGRSMELVVLDLLARRGMTLAAYESLTGGVLTARMNDADSDMATFKASSISPAGPDHVYEEGAVLLAHGHGPVRNPCRHCRRCRDTR